MNTNINAAIAEANRNNRAKQILSEGYTFTFDAQTGTVAVCKPGKLSAAYFIGEQLSGKDGCDCPDFQRRGIDCKHMLAWEMLKAEEEMQISRMAFRAEEDKNADF